MQSEKEGEANIASAFSQLGRASKKQSVLHTFNFKARSAVNAPYSIQRSYTAVVTFKFQETFKVFVIDYRFKYVNC